MSVRIAMWSGPRNISTAMMRAFENRPDCVVWDEPLYAHYLQATGLDHPGREEIIQAGDTEWQQVVKRCTGSIPDGKAVFYQKHMSHHLLPHINRDWLQQLDNILLIRDPQRVLASYVKSRQNVTLDDIGIVQQLSLFEQLRPLVIDSADFLRQAEAYLRALCEHLGIPFYPNMLSWPAGSRASDGIWAKYWYAQVQQSTGFAPYQERPVKLSTRLQVIAEQAQPYYHTLYQARLQL